MSIFFSIPWATDKNIGNAYNKVMESLPSDDDFACFIDGDAMLLQPFFGKQIEDCIAKYPDCGIFTCKTNRIQCKWQQEGDWDSNDIAKHREYAQKLCLEHYADCDLAPRVEQGHLLGGVLMCIKKSVWKKMGGFKQGLLGVDNELHISAQEHNEPIRVMKGVYVYHWYRGGDVSNKAHLALSQDAPQSPIRKTLEERQNARFVNRRGIPLQRDRRVIGRQAPELNTVRPTQERGYERTELINDLILKHGYTSYLEIGVQNPNSNFNHVVATHKVGVDPDPKANATLTLTSDDFFAKNTKKFDIIFIDGLHESTQVIQDIKNSFSALKEGGTILVHDCLPTTKEMQQVPRIARTWTGDVWKAILHFRSYHNYSIEILDIETGIGVLKRGTQETISIKNPTYENFVKYKHEWFKIVPYKPLKKVIYSAIIGDYDEPISHELPFGWTYKLFTDNRNIKGDCVTYIDVPSDLSPTKFARKIKILPWEYIDFDICLWVDGNTRFKKEEIWNLAKHDFVASSHPMRNCLYEEGEKIVELQKDNKEMVDRVLERYEKDGFPKDYGLIASHAIIRKNTEQNKNLCTEWWKEVRGYSHRDQLSFGYVLWKNPIDIHLVPFKTIFTTVSIHRKKQL